MVCAPVWGQQVAFEARKSGLERVVDAQWKDPKGEHRLRFAFAENDIVQAAREFQLFDNKEAETRAFWVMQSAAAQYNSEARLVQVIPQAGGVTISTHGFEKDDVDRIVSDLEKVRDKAYADYIYSKFYMSIDKDHLMPDHKRIALRYAKAMAPLAQAVRLGMKGEGLGHGPRETINYVLHFYQSIPYDMLLDRYTSNGAGFETPYTVIIGNKGDCESKSVALAATLRALYPTLRLTLVYVPEHTFLGIGVPMADGDFVMERQGVRYVLADPTGPAFLELGQVSDKALANLKRGDFSYQEIPF